MKVVEVHHQRLPLGEAAEQQPERPDDQLLRGVPAELRRGTVGDARTGGTPAWWRGERPDPPRLRRRAPRGWSGAGRRRSPRPHRPRCRPTPAAGRRTGGSSASTRSRANAPPARSPSCAASLWRSSSSRRDFPIPASPTTETTPPVPDSSPLTARLELLHLPVATHQRRAEPLVRATHVAVEVLATRDDLVHLHLSALPLEGEGVEGPELEGVPACVGVSLRRSRSAPSAPGP